MQLQTIFKAGNSDVVAIPLEVRKKTGLKTGSNIIVEVAPDGETVVISKAGNNINRSFITPGFINWLGDFNKKYGSALRDLATK